MWQHTFELVLMENTKYCSVCAHTAPSTLALAVEGLAMWGT